MLLIPNTRHTLQIPGGREDTSWRVSERETSNMRGGPPPLPSWRYSKNILCSKRSAIVLRRFQVHKQAPCRRQQGRTHGHICPPTLPLMASSSYYSSTSVWKVCLPISMQLPAFYVLVLISVPSSSSGLNFFQFVTAMRTNIWQKPSSWLFTKSPSITWIRFPAFPDNAQEKVRVQDSLGVERMWVGVKNNPQISSSRWQSPATPLGSAMFTEYPPWVRTESPPQGSTG